MTDERLARIRERIEIDRHYYIKSDCAPEGETEWFVDTMDLLAEVDRLREELAEARDDARWAGMTDAQKDEAIRQAARDVR